MKKCFLLIIILSLIAIGCSHTIYKYSNENNSEFYNRIIKICESQDELIIETIHKEKYSARKLRITVDTTSFIENNSNRIISKSTSEISLISFSKMSRGAFDGFLIGTLVGGGIGLLSQTKAMGGAAPKGDLSFVLYSTLAGSAIGITYGLINPGRITIKLN